MEVSYLSHSLTNDTPSYGNRDHVKIIPKSEISNGETSNTSHIEITNNHIGTHIDVPKHFYDNGKTITDIDPIEWVFNSICIIDIPCDEAKLIDVNDLDNSDILPDTDFLIIRTGYENKRYEDAYWNSYPGISEIACEYLRSNFPQLRAIGFDFISLTSPKFKPEGKKAHLSLLDERKGRFIFIIEDMKIAHLTVNPEQAVVIPLLVQNGNGGAVTILSFSKNGITK